MQSKAEVLGENPVQIPLYVPQIPHQLPCCIIRRPIKVCDVTKALLTASSRCHCILLTASSRCHCILLTASSRCHCILLTATLTRFLKHKTLYVTYHVSQYDRSRHLIRYAIVLSRECVCYGHITCFSMLQSHHVSVRYGHVAWFSVLQSNHVSQYARSHHAHQYAIVPSRESVR